MPEPIENRMVVDSEVEEPDRPFVTCSKCGAQIYLETDTEYPDERYQIDGEDYCADCIEDVAKELFRIV